ncbi:PH domain-containing protein [Candidatus Epulonipiscium viviparus]|uniref:PH domain-containing protein n=1 Tax=Candidatus Epulonipiscium viviparus TaxID=420336 RepID=UPI0027380E9F|nr:PH domain-containing protein [Candidatus Epulopiscium viviparus]
MNIINGKLNKASDSEYSSILEGLLADGEGILATYKAINDGIVFTNRRIIGIDFKGVTGKQVRYTSLPYKQILFYYIETAGIADSDCELELWLSLEESIKLNFAAGIDIFEVGKIIASYIK